MRSLLLASAAGALSWLVLRSGSAKAASRGRAADARAYQDAETDVTPESHRLPAETSAQPLQLPERAVWPVPGARVPVAAVLQPGYQRTATHVHRGLDVPAAEGTPVLAPLAGRVVRTVEQYTPGFRGYGKAVVLELGTEPPRWMLFAHLSDVRVMQGDRVEAGARLGSVGKTKYSKADPAGNLKSGPHLHLELAERPYPMGAEASRLDPRALF